MNFLYMAYGVAILLAMMFCIFILTFCGNFILSKDQLNSVITPLFFFGLAAVGFLNARKSPDKKAINALLLNLILVAIMGVFIQISGFIPKAFNQFILFSLLSLISGSLLYFISMKIVNTQKIKPTVNH
ncbi:MAG: hypothetical protein H9855_16635 [Candidatus Acinetobacter avistercoris]|uniref:hypothetical protein n=1 Tax=Acinetobacter sp. KS-LM10 TaxID=3120518 RepID=UPI001F88C5CD|nr:hypothetical protein [Candidatus Acinetobacter avistercoris]